MTPAREHKEWIIVTHDAALLRDLGPAAALTGECEQLMRKCPT
jgi:hypothetical protein